MSGQDNPDLIGTVLAGRYRIESLLGVGAMGAVYVGEHLHIGRRDAIKVLRPSLAQDREAIARFTRGARNASAIRHPNVCAIYDFGTTEAGLHYLAMEYVAGATLTDVMEGDGPFPAERATAILLQAAGALQAAHDRGIVHRDLKPDNIMLAAREDGAESVKVVDFDIALGPPEGEGARVTRHGYVVGTPEYMSPEQLTGDELDGRSDVYSLALVFFRMITGRLPFPDGTAQEVMVHRLTGDPLSLAEAAPDAAIPPDLEPVIRKALARRAAERHESVEAFAREVHEVVGAGAPGSDHGRSGSSASAGAPAGAAAGEGGEIPATRVSSSTGRSSAGGAGGRRRALVAGAATGLVLLAAGGGAVLLTGGEGEDGDSVALATDDPDEEEPAEEPPDDPVGDPAEEPEDPGEEPVPPEDPGDPDEAEDPEGDPEGAEEAEEDEAEEPEDVPGPDPGPAEAPPPEMPAPDADAPAGLVELPDDAATQVVARMLDRLDPYGDSPASDPEELAAIRDTLHAVWFSAPITRSDSATTANNLFLVFNRLGETSHADRWFEQAEELDDWEDESGDGGSR